MRFEEIDVTPSLAGQWLGSMIENRPLRAAYVKQLAADIQAGKWRVTHQAIAFDKSGMLFDGQHRLQAVILSGRTIRMLVARDADPATFNVLDTGPKRSSSDLYVLMGGENNYLTLRIGMARAACVRGGSTTTREDVATFAVKHHSAIQLVLGYIGVKSGPSWVSSAVRGAYLNAIIEHGADKIEPLLREQADDLFVDTKHPLKMLRDRLVSVKMSGRRIAQHEQYVLAEKSIAFRLEGKSVGSLKYKINRTKRRVIA